MSVKYIEDIEKIIVEGGVGTTKQVLIPADEGPNFAMRCFTMEAGGGMPNHTNLVEHEQYVLRGWARIGIGEETYEVQAGSVVFIPAQVPHWYTNIGDEPFQFLCLVPNQPDVTTILE
jgi:quercetin dioxygenase-like cupin family protein